VGDVVFGTVQLPSRRTFSNAPPPAQAPVADANRARGGRRTGGRELFMPGGGTPMGCSGTRALDDSLRWPTSSNRGGPFGLLSACHQQLEVVGRAVANGRIASSTGTRSALTWTNSAGRRSCRTVNSRPNDQLRWRLAGLLPAVDDHVGRTGPSWRRISGKTATDRLRRRARVAGEMTPLTVPRSCCGLRMLDGGRQKVEHPC